VRIEWPRDDQNLGSARVSSPLWIAQLASKMSPLVVGDDTSIRATAEEFDAVFVGDLIRVVMRLSWAERFLIGLTGQGFAMVRSGPCERRRSAR
jgi:hypothetical protein